MKEKLDESKKFFDHLEVKSGMNINVDTATLLYSCIRTQVFIRNCVLIVSLELHFQMTLSCFRLTLVSRFPIGARTKFLKS